MAAVLSDRRRRPATATAEESDPEPMSRNHVLDLEFCRAQFPPLANGWVYFENAGGSYVPRPVIERMTAYLSECKNQPHPNFAAGRLAAARLDEAQASLAAMINAERDEIVVGPSTTLNVYILAQGLRHLFRPGDEIVVTNQDHEANGGAWRRLDEFGVVLREWRIDTERGELHLSDLDPLLSARTRLVCFPHVSNIVGSINPVAEITAKAHAVGAMVCVDAVAYAAHGPIDVKAWDVDFYLFSLYKLYGPHIAVLYGKREAIARCSNQNHFFHAGNYPENLHPGGLTYESVAAAAGIADYVEAVYEHHFDEPANSAQARAARVFELFAAQEQAIAQRFVDYLLSKPQVRLIGAQTGDRRRRMPTFSFLVEGRSSKAVAEAVARDEIAIGHGHFYGYRAVEALGVEDMDDGVVRVSMVHYNTLDEVERLIAALEKVVA
jgi:cysteine desulfurase family protein (TIGR01976 family)